MEAGNEVGSNLKSIFYRVDSDRNGLIDIKELYNALKQSNENDFNPETCQLLMGLFDVNEDGYIDMSEFGGMVKYIRSWKSTFGLHVANSTVPGINSTQLHNTLQACGCGLDETMCKVLIKNFDSRNMQALGFDDYMRCCVTVQSMYKAFTHQQSPDGTLRLDLEGLVTMVVESRARPVQNLAFD